MLSKQYVELVTDSVRTDEIQGVDLDDPEYLTCTARIRIVKAIRRGEH